MGYIDDFLLILLSDPIKTPCFLIPRVHWLTAALRAPRPRLHLSGTALLQLRVTVDAL